MRIMRARWFTPNGRTTLLLTRHDHEIARRETERDLEVTQRMYRRMLRARPLLHTLPYRWSILVSSTTLSEVVSDCIIGLRSRCSISSSIIL